MKVTVNRTMLIIDRDMSEKLATVVYEHEVPIMQEVHGESKVIRYQVSADDSLSMDAIGGPTEIDVREEYNRLGAKYGRHNEQNVLYVDMVYGRWNERRYAQFFEAGGGDVIRDEEFEIQPKRRARPVVNADIPAGARP